MFGGNERGNKFLNFPVVSGNVSFYNGTNKKYLPNACYRWCWFNK